jgi:aminopeptidase
MDKRLQNFARTIVRYSINAQPGETILINSTPLAEELCVAVYEELLRAKALPALRIQPETVLEKFFQHAGAAHYEKPNPYDLAGLKAIDGTIRISAASNTRTLAHVKPAKQAALAKMNRALSRTMKDKKWTLTLFPTAAYAQDAEMSLTDFEDFVYSATFSDEKNPVAAWKRLSRKQDKLIRHLEGADDVRIIGPDTDLRLSVKGRTFINSPGTNNLPSGEVYTGPVEHSAEGFIRYDYPVVHSGKEIDGIQLRFHKGKVVEASATKNQAFLRTMLELDPGAKRLGELGIGTNFRIQRFIKNILFDEKIGGTVHLALGNAYPKTGGKNKSALHWDMIKDLRKGGELLVNGKCIQRNGKFLGNIF